MKQLLVILTLVTWQAHGAFTEEHRRLYFDENYKKAAQGKDPLIFSDYQNVYAGKIDFAKLEYSKRFRTADDAKKFKEFLWQLTPDDILKMDQEIADQLYARLTAGPIPDGAFFGKADMQKDSSFLHISERFLHVVKFDMAALKRAIANLWHGKVFYKNRRVLKNLIPRESVQSGDLDALFPGLPGGRKVKDLLGRSANAVPNPLKTTEQVYEMFPAKLYCGQSLMDSRRESVIIDYAYSDTIQPDYNENPSINFLASRHGMYIRDEIRMVHPGMYLGKAYVSRAFFLTFILNNPTVEAQYKGQTDWSSMEECWSEKPLGAIQ